VRFIRLVAPPGTGLLGGSHGLYAVHSCGVSCASQAGTPGAHLHTLHNFQQTKAKNQKQKQKLYSKKLKPTWYWSARRIIRSSSSGGDSDGRRPVYLQQQQQQQVSGIRAAALRTLTHLLSLLNRYAGYSPQPYHKLCSLPQCTLAAMQQMHNDMTNAPCFASRQLQMDTYLILTRPILSHPSTTTHMNSTMSSAACPSSILVPALIQVNAGYSCCAALNRCAS
jgi:hypothetical protein